MKIFITLCLLFTSIYANAMSFYTVNLPPFSLVSDQQISGPFKDVASEACRIAGLKCEFKSAPWKRIMSGIKDGHYEGCFVVGKNKSRSDWMYFTTEIAETEYGFFYHTNSKRPVESKSALSGKTVIVHDKSNTHKQLLKLQQKIPSLKISVHNDINTAIKMFAKGRFGDSTLLYGNRDIIQAMYKEIGLDNVKYTFKDKPITYRFGLSKKSVKLNEFNRFDMVLRKMKASGQIKKIFASYELRAAKN